MVHTTPEIVTSNLILDFEFDQHLESHKHVINIIMGFRDMGCYINDLHLACPVVEKPLKNISSLRTSAIYSTILSLLQSYSFCTCFATN
jgi:hypothetical protein